MLFKTAVIIGLVILIILGVTLLVDFRNNRFTDKQIVQNIHVQNKKLPEMLDKSTELTSIIYGDDMIVYNYRMIKYDVSEIDVEQFHRQIRQKLLKKICSTQSLKAYFANGIVFSHNYNDKNGNDVKDIIITHKDCIELKM